jgi:hypothetical protein
VAAPEKAPPRIATSNAGVIWQQDDGLRGK